MIVFDKNMESLIFDLDGTLVSLEFDVVGSRRAIISMLQKKGLKMEGVDFQTPTQLLLERAEIEAIQANLSFQSIREEVFSILNEFEVLSAKNTRMMDDALVVLERLKNSGRKLALVTNTGRKALQMMEARFSLGRFFVTTLTRDEVPAMKPRPEGLELAIRIMGCDKSNTWYVGDSIYDMRAAKLCGIRSIGVTTGKYSRNKLQEEGAEFVIGSLSELLSMFNT